MNDFTKPERSLPELIIQGTVDLNVEQYTDDHMLNLVQKWNRRSEPYAPESDIYCTDKTQVFTISYEGETDSYWPSMDSNMFAEALVRDVLYTDGICSLESMDPKLFQIKFKVLAMIETEYLLILPYPTESGNIAGLVVVCINNYLRPK